MWGGRGSCTTCQMAEDFSNYWTAVMYFKHPTNGSLHRVPVVNNAALAAGTTGGITVYYTQYDLSRDNLKSQPITTFKQVRYSYAFKSPAAIHCLAIAQLADLFSSRASG